jgi:hypothetical protein
MVKIQLLVRLLALILLAAVALSLFAATVLRADGVPVQKANLVERRVYAYRGWQSMGIALHPGEIVTITARGKWLYSPQVGYYGPEGAPRSKYPAPSYYPLPNGIGGCLIGRIGESGDPFYVGQRATIRSDTTGLLYLRINDDIVTDNDGFLTVEITVKTPPGE